MDDNNFRPQRSTSPTNFFRGKRDKRFVDEVDAESGSNNHNTNSLPPPLGSGLLKKMKSGRRTNSSFSKLSEGLKALRLGDKNLMEDYSNQIEKGHNYLLELCNEFFDFIEVDAIENDKNQLNNLFKDKSLTNSSSIEDTIESLLNDIESCKWQSGHLLLALALGFIGPTQQGGNAKKCCQTILDCNGISILIFAFQLHASKFLDFVKLQMISTTTISIEEKEFKEKEKYFNLFTNLLFIVITILSWNPSNSEDNHNNIILEELRYDLFEKEEERKEQHFFFYLYSFLKEVEFLPQHVISLKKITMLIHRTLHVLFLCDQHSKNSNNQKRIRNSRLSLMFQKEKHIKLKLLRESKSEFLKEVKGFDSKILKEASDVVLKAPEKKSKLDNNEINIPRILIENPSLMEKFYRLMLNDFSGLITCLLNIIDRVTKGEGLLTLKNNEEIKRYCNIILKSILSIILLFIKKLKTNCFMQSKYIINLLNESETYILIFRILDQDVTSFILQEELADVSIMKGNHSSSKTNWRNVYILVSSLRILNQITKDNPFLISKLLRKYKMHLILKRILKVDEIESLCKHTCKILKNCLRQLPQRWKEENMQVINNIYFHVRPTLNDTSWIQQITQTIQLSQTEFKTEQKRIREEIQLFNNRNYLEWWKYVGHCFEEEFVEQQLLLANKGNKGITIIDSIVNNKKKNNQHFNYENHLVFTKEDGFIGLDYCDYIYQNIKL